MGRQAANMKITIKGSYYKRLEEARAKAERLNKIFGRAAHTIINLETGWLVVSKRQLVYEKKP